MEPQTQKAKGILGLAAHPPNTFSIEYVKKVTVYPHSPVQTFPFFARPCPKEPRHGFVESRVIETLDQWNALVAEVQAAEEGAEIVMMPFIHCQYSGVLTETGVSYGPGHDGSTGGQEARAVPAACSKTQLLHMFGLTQAASVSALKDSPFLEFVEQSGTLQAVQLRSGTAVPLFPMYVPCQMIVQEIVTPTPAEIKELLAWEKRMKTLKGRPGVVIHFPGGVMHSHVAVQAIEQTKHTEHPFAVFVTTECPKVGDALEPVNAVDPMTPQECEELAAMLASSITNVNLDTPTSQSEAIRLGVAALHASPFWSGDRHLLILRAMAVGSLLKFASAAVLGELRHWRSRGPGRYNNVRLTTPLDEDERLGKLSRDQVYDRAFKLHVKLLAPRMGTAYKDFRTKGWSGSFGGKKASRR